MKKILALGNEFIKEDSLAKDIADLLKEDLNIINIKDSFQLIDELRSNDDIIILDVVKGLDKVKLINPEDLKIDSISSVHDFDAGFIIKLINKDIKIIGIPMIGDINEIKNQVLELLS